MDYILAFSAGLLSFLSPCVLPLIPLYLSHLVGTTVTEINTRQAKMNLLLRAALFATGFSIVFIIFGVSVSAIGQLFTEHMDLIRKIGGVVIVIFGLHMTGIFKIKLLYMEKRLQSNKKSASGNVSSLLLGMAFAVGWTPCIGPILSSILIYASSMETVSKGTFLLVLYSIGFAIPLLLSALFVAKINTYLKKISRYLPIIAMVSGIIMIIMGVLVFTNKLEVFNQYGSLFNL